MLQALDNAILAVTNILYQPFIVPLILVVGRIDPVECEMSFSTEK